MTPEQWSRVSAWHSAWREADAPGRTRLREQFATEHPDLVAECDALIGSEEALPGFLETSAFVLTASQMATEATLAPGLEVGPYRIVDLAGHGGMGIVYRADDPRLGRQVAVKMLSPVGVPDAAQVERFVQEARLTASVDHPNIVKVYDVGVFGGQPYMVIELLGGETLRARLDRGRMPVDDARRIATDVSRGLAAAHAAGLVHRDLKPENVILTRDGITKIVDFGIAKLTSDDVERRASASTLTGILLGTAGYLAPEQIRGDAVDSRADLFALGSILFEMLTSERAFACENTVDTLHAILHEPAPDVTGRRADIPRALAQVVGRLLAKEPGDRFQSAADVAWALGRGDETGSSDPGVHEKTAPAGMRSRGLAWVAIAAAGLAGLGGWWLGRESRDDAPPAGPVRFAWDLPDGTGLLSPPMISPDGSRIAWVGGDSRQTRWLFVRELASADAIRIPGTDDARHPFWAPDGSALGFFAHGQLKKVVLQSGAPVVLAPAPDARGGAWSPSGLIVFQPMYRDAPLMSVSDQGGPITPITVLDSDYEDVSHRWPAFLPDGRAFLYTIVSSQDDRRGVFLASLDDPPARPGQQLFASDSGAAFVPLGPNGEGTLVSVTDGRISVRTFDPARPSSVGDPRTLDVGAVPTSPRDPALVSTTGGVLAFSGDAIPWGYHFASVRRDGSNLRVAAEPELGGFPRVSPDGRLVARTIADPVKANADIWVEDHTRGGRLRLTTSTSFDVMPVWSPDGRRVAHRSGTLVAPSISITSADGSGVTRTLPCPRIPCEPTDWAPDGEYLVLNVAGTEIWSLPLDAQPAPKPLFSEPFPVRDARVSHDGRWAAYVSAESGRAEVSVRSLVGPARRYMASTEGGDQPVWRSDGKEIFFASSDGQLHAVTVRTGTDGGLVLSAPERLPVPSLGERHWGTTYDVSRNGQVVFFPHPGPARPGTSFSVITGWAALLR